MKKRILSILLAFVMVVGLLPATALAAAKDNAIKLELVKDTTTFADKEVLRMDFYYKSGSDTPNDQMVYLKANEASLSLLNANSGNAASATILSDFSVNRSAAITKNNYTFHSSEMEMNVNSEAILYCVSKGGYTYIGWKITENKDASDVPAFADFTRISSIFFGLKEGVTFDAIPGDAIGYSDPAADGSITSASAATTITVNGGGTGNVFKYKDKNGTDTMTVAPAVTAGDDVTIAKPAYSGTVDAPTVSKNTGGSVELTAQAISGETVEYGYSTSNDASAVSNWQTGTTFNGLTVGTTYYFFTRVTETAEHQAKASTGTSVVAAAATLTGIAIAGSTEAAVPTKAAGTATVTLTATASYDDSTTGNVTSAAAWSIDGTYDGVSVSGGVVTILPSAAAGTVTVKAEYGGKEAIHNITLTKADAGTLFSMTISGADSVSVPGEYTYNVTGEDKYGASVTPGSVTWSINGETPTGVSIGSSDGKLSVTNDAIAGSVTIKATSGTVSDTKTVTITKAASVVSSVTISGGVSSLTVPTVSAIGGEASTNAGTAFSAELKDQYGATISGTVTWNVTGNSGVTIDQNGLLSIKNTATGDTVTVKAKCGEKEATKTVTVTKATPEATFIQICKGGSAVTSDGITIPTSGDTTVNYTAEVYDQYGKEFTTDIPTWDITSATGVSVTGGAVKVENTASERNVTLTATSSTKSTLKVEVTITLSNKPAHNIGTFADANKTITYGDSYAGQTVSSTTGTVKYSSSDSSAVSVNESTGALTIHKATSGAVTITATVEETSTYAEATASYTITVNKKELVITGLTATNRDYAAGSTTVALAGGELTGIVGEDDVYVTMPTSGTMTDANAGSGKAVTVTTPTLSGADKDNYTLKAISGITVTINKIDPDVGTVTKNSPSTIYTSTVLNSITLSKTGSAVGELKLTAGQTLTVGTAGYEWTFTPTDSTNYNTATGTVSLTVENDTLNSISIGSTTPSKTTYKYGETFETTGLTVTATYASGATKVLTSSEYTVTNGTMTMGQTSVTLSYQGQTCTVSGLTVNKADAPTGIQTTQNIGHKYSVSGAQTVAFPAGLPTDKGTTTYAVSDINNSNGVLTGTTTVDENGVVTYTLAGQPSYTADQTASFKVTATMANYESVTVTYTITLTNKDTPVVEANDITVTYTGAEIPVSAITGTAKFGDADVLGSWSWKTTAPKNVADSSDSVTVVFTPTDAVNYETVEDTIKVTINKATPTGAPTYTKITTSGKTLANANLTIGTIAPAGGTLAWDMPVDTVVAANTAYGWTYTPTPADAANYKVLTSSITPYVVTYYGGGSAATPSVSDKAAKELKNAKEGSTVTIDMKGETKLPASVTKEIAGKDVTVELDMGGGMVWSFNGLDVPKGGVRLDLGVKTGTKTIPAKVINALTGEMTTVQLQLNHNGSFGMSLNLSVDLGKKHDGMYANLYFYNPKSSALEFRSAGMISGGKASWAFDHASDYAIVIDKESHEPMTFTDVPDTAYYAEAVNWAVAKKITGGVGNNLFAPNATCTRAQAVTFLWRAAGSPAPKSSENPFTDVKAGSYYYDAVLWAVENGITNGTSATAFSPNATCSRAQIVTFLWRSQKSPAADTVNPFTDVAADSYYANAVVWAAENGITGGTSATTFSPSNNCTRAQIVTFLFRCLGE